MTLDELQQICRSLPGVTEDVKWGQDLCFCVGGKMFAAVNLELPHQLGFKCTPEDFAELTERDGIVPAPYLARAMWVQERELGAALDRRELATLLRSAYDLVVAKLPKSKRPGVVPGRTAGKGAGTAKKPGGGTKKRSSAKRSGSRRR
jgi:predicted DNA-binding protein (MmcQ/YjbR family)